MKVLSLNKKLYGVEKLEGVLILKGFCLFEFDSLVNLAHVSYVWTKEVR